MSEAGSAILHAASEVWQAIVQRAGLDLRNYDEPLLAELSANLAIPSLDFTNELDRAGITVEALLDQVLHLLAPYAKMMKDLLAFFARAGAQSSAENLRIRFEFDSVVDNFEFDLSNFRDWEVQFSEALTKALGDEIDNLLALQLRHAFVAQGITYQIVGSTWSDFTPSDVAATRWLALTETHPEAVAALPPPPGVIDPELRALLTRVWRFLRASAVRTMNDVGTQALSADDIRMIVRGAYLLQSKEALLSDQLRRVFIDIKRNEIETTVVIEQLIEVLNLPIWKQRSEFYSVWVGAQLISAFGERVRVHVVDGSLVFSFGGAHLATVSISSRENLHVWCELRTKGTGLLGKGRRRAIQPDYVVLREPTSHPDSAILVVECKQYLRQSRRGFADALIDYANGHRKAEVILVNYGPITSSILERVAETDSALLTRTRVIGEFRPGSTIAIQEFEALISSVAPGVMAPAAAIAKSAVSAPVADTNLHAAAGSLRLYWQTDVDLDLHCWITDAHGGQQHVHYANRMGDLEGSRVKLDRDVRRGGEAETLNWDNTDPVRLEFAVHAFSGSDIVQAQAQVEVNTGDHVWIIQPPPGQRGTWWKLFRVEQAGSPVRIWNSVGSEALFAE